MARTWREFGEENPQQSWRRIRNLRAAPPTTIQSVLESGPGRADAFHTGLEQSEQLFRAASRVERESRPLLLFYGLGQAGRAISAASGALNAEDRAWASSGHGLKVERLASWQPSGLWAAEIRVRPGKRDLFSRSSIALGSAQDLIRVPLGDLAANIAEFIAEFPSPVSANHLLHLESMHLPAQTSTPHQPVAFPVRVPTGLDDVEAFIHRYPVLADYPLLCLEDGRPAVDHNGLHLLQVPASDFDWHGRRGELRGRQMYRGSAVAVAALGGSRAPVHPLMVWWMLLYALSMLARYEPSKWHDVLDIRTSSIWSQVEYLQDRALDSVPDLLAAALEDM